VKYLLDTNICIALINGTSNLVRRRYLQVSRPGDLPGVCVVVAHELWYGVSKSNRIVENANRLIAFLTKAVVVEEYSEPDSRAAGEIRAELERQGTRIGEYDTLIAGQAFARNLILVTANTSEFSRVKGLQVEDWTI
jgi:tRNA(fMet)-specific endonuclease VapC